jgi:hypothetical protein
MSRNQGTAKPPGSSNRSSAGNSNRTGAGNNNKPATGRPTAVGNQVTNLNQGNGWSNGTNTASSINQTRRTDLKWTKAEADMQAYGLRQQGNIFADFEERRERNINAPRQIRDLNAQMNMTDRQASAQENVAAEQAAANKFAAKQQAEAQKFSATKQAISQLGAAKAGADAQMFAAKQDAQARLGVAGMEQKASLKKTASEERSNFKNMLGNLAASMGEKGARQREAVISAATTAAGNATSASNAEADRMADIYKNIMGTYNTGNQQFRYW